MQGHFFLKCIHYFNSLNTKKQTTHFSTAKKKKKKKNIHANSYSKFRDWRTNSVELDEVAHYEPPHKDLHCLQIYLFSSLALKEFGIDGNLLKPVLQGLLLATSLCYTSSNCRIFKQTLIYEDSLR